MRNIDKRLFNALSLNEVDKIKQLIERGADLNAQTEYEATPIHIVACVGDAAIADILLNNGANVNIQTTSGVSPLHCA